jgi:hypothetical protein
MRSSKRRSSRALSSFSLATAAIAACGLSANAIEPATTAAQTAATNTISFAQVPVSSEGIVVLLENADLKVIRDSGATQISLRSSCPGHWNVANSLIRQAGFAKQRNGISITADALGSRAILNGKVYALPEQMGGLQSTKDGLIVGGKKMDPLAGSDVPGDCGGTSDLLEVIVPDSYSGNLTIGASSDSHISLANWRGGDLKITMLGSSRLEAGMLKDLNKASIDIRGTASARIGDVAAKVLVTNVDGTGAIDVESGSAAITNATVSGNGKIQMRGKFDNLKQSVQGSGTIKVN